MDPLYGHSCVHAPTTLKQFEKRCRDDARICMVSRLVRGTVAEGLGPGRSLVGMRRKKSGLWGDGEMSSIAVSRRF